MGAAGVVTIMIVAGACHAGWNLLAKQVHTDRTLLLIAASAVVVVGLAPCGATHLPAQWWPALGWVVLRGVLNVVYLVGLSRSYRAFDLSLAYPLVRGIGPVVATVLAVGLLGERPAAVGLLGLGVVTLSILALAATGRRTVEGAAARPGLHGVAVVLLTGVTIGAYTAVDKVALRYWDPVSYFWGVEVTALAVAAAYLLAAGRSRELVSVARRHLPAAVACAGLIGASYVLALVALQHSLASYIAPLREVSVLFGALLGMLVLKEDHGARRLAAALGMTVGLVLVGFAL